VKVVVDASVAVKWFLASRPDEAGADLALNLLERIAGGDVRMVQPPHFIAEVAAVLARLKPDEAEDDLLDLQNIEHASVDTPEIYATALELAVRYQHHLFDTLYHAVALHTQDAVLVTADRRYYDKALGEGQIETLETFGLGGDL
jgi:predicted nucleic acid-binding protein